MTERAMSLDNHTVLIPVLVNRHRSDHGLILRAPRGY
jgi:hypothetical protein